MKKNIIYLAALAVMTAACSNEDDTILTGGEMNGAADVKMITETVTATNGDGSASTRAAVDASAAFTWTAGDQIAVHVSDGNYYTTTALAAGGNNTAEFSVTYPDGKTRDAFAVFPAAIVAADAANYGQSSTALDVTLPGSYAITEVSGTTTPCPMIADNTGSGWQFKQLCAMLRLTVTDIPATATYLTIDFNGKKVQGAFSIATPVTVGTSTIATTATDGTDDIITVTGLTGAATTYDINLPLPTGDYTNVTVTAYNSSDLALLTTTRPMKASGTYTAQRAKGRKVNAPLPAFSVSASKKVAFSPGNLQYNQKNNPYYWRFAEHQYDYVGKWDTSTWVDLFGWGTWTGGGDITDPFNTLIPLSTNESSGYYVWNSDDFNSESRLVDETQRNYDWRTLTGGETGEWMYLFGLKWDVSKSKCVDDADNAVRYQKAAHGKVYVNGLWINGLIIVPDNFIDPMKNGESKAFVGGVGTNLLSNVYSAANWAAMEAAGCVFLPFANYRVGNSINNDTSLYWSSTPNGFSAYALGFNSNSLNGRGGAFTNIGASVRLVRDL